MNPSRDRIANEVGELMTEYNRRNHPLKVYEIPLDPAAEKDPFSSPPLERSIKGPGRILSPHDGFRTLDLRLASELEPLLKPGTDFTITVREALEATLPRLEEVLTPLEKARGTPSRNADASDGSEYNRRAKPSPAFLK